MSGPTATIPSDRLYWSILHLPERARLRAGVLPIGLRAEFEADVPIAREDACADPALMGKEGLHIVFAPLDDGRIIACGAPVGELKSAAGQASALTPAGLPPFILEQFEAGTAGVERGREGAPDRSIVRSLNLLIGELEPAHARAARLRRGILLLAAAAIALLFMAAGLERRVRNDRAVAAAAVAGIDNDLRELGRSIDSPIRFTADALPAAAAVAQRTLDAAARVQVPGDAAAAMAAMLPTWPVAGSAEPGWKCTIQSLGITAESIAATVTIEGDAAGFLRAIAMPPGWTLDEPRLTTLGGRAATGTAASSPPTLTRIALTMKRRPAEEVRP